MMMRKKCRIACDIKIHFGDDVKLDIFIHFFGFGEKKFWCSLTLNVFNPHFIICDNAEKYFCEERKLRRKKEMPQKKAFDKLTRRRRRMRMRKKITWREFTSWCCLSLYIAVKFFITNIIIIFLQLFRFLGWMMEMRS